MIYDFILPGTCYIFFSVFLKFRNEKIRQGTYLTGLTPPSSISNLVLDLPIRAYTRLIMSLPSYLIVLLKYYNIRGLLLLELAHQGSYLTNQVIYSFFSRHGSADRSGMIEEPQICWPVPGTTGQKHTSSWQSYLMMAARKIANSEM